MIASADVHEVPPWTVPGAATVLLRQRRRGRHNEENDPDVTPSRGCPSLPPV